MITVAVCVYRKSAQSSKPFGHNTLTSLTDRQNDDDKGLT